MLKIDAEEAKPIVRRAMENLMLTVKHLGRAGSDVRTAVGDLLAHLDELLLNDAIGQPLDNCFDLARKSGATIDGIATTRIAVVAETPRTQGAMLIKNALIVFCLATNSRITVDMTFTSRDDVTRLKERISKAFFDMEEIAADTMDIASYRALVRLHAALSHYLIETARPLPRMLAFRFAAPLATLVAAHRLYDDAGRADELRDENKVVHPAFMRQEGRALSA